MVGVIKQIIDEVGICDATFVKYTGTKEQINPLIKEITITQGVAIIVKN